MKRISRHSWEDVFLPDRKPATLPSERCSWWRRDWRGYLPWILASLAMVPLWWLITTGCLAFAEYSGWPALPLIGMAGLAAGALLVLIFRD